MSERVCFASPVSHDCLIQILLQHMWPFLNADITYSGVRYVEITHKLLCVSSFMQNPPGALRPLCGSSQTCKHSSAPGAVFKECQHTDVTAV